MKSQHHVLTSKRSVPATPPMLSRSPPACASARPPGRPRGRPSGARSARRPTARRPPAESGQARKRNEDDTSACVRPSADVISTTARHPPELPHTAPPATCASSTWASPGGQRPTGVVEAPPRRFAWGSSWPHHGGASCRAASTLGSTTGSAPPDRHFARIELKQQRHYEGRKDDDRGPCGLRHEQLPLHVHKAPFTTSPHTPNRSRRFVGSLRDVHPDIRHVHLLSANIVR